MVNCDVNASAGFRKGFLSIIARQDLVLVIGLPLVAGLTLRQFAGVLAHEFGHFTQGAGMRLGYVIRMINLWFVRVVYERDAWDERLEWLAARGGGRLWLVLQSIRFSVWLSRRVLWLLMKAAQAMSCYLSRQMEFHADKYFFRLVGAETMAAAFHRLPILAFASEGAWSDLDDFYRDGRLGDNLPKLIIANVKQFSKEVLAQIDKTVDETESSVFNTHPADKVRIAQAAAENPAGVFRIEAPAAVLFRDFDNLSRQSTWDQYVELFDGQVQANQVHPVDELIARQERDIAGNKAIGRFFQGSFTVLRPLPVANWSSLLKQDAQSAATTLRRARQDAGHPVPVRHRLQDLRRGRHTADRGGAGRRRAAGEIPGRGRHVQPAHVVAGGGQRCPLLGREPPGGRGRHAARVRTGRRAADHGRRPAARRTARGRADRRSRDVPVGGRPLRAHPGPDVPADRRRDRAA